MGIGPEPVGRPQILPPPCQPLPSQSSCSTSTMLTEFIARMAFRDYQWKSPISNAQYIHTHTAHTQNTSYYTHYLHIAPHTHTPYYTHIKHTTHILHTQITQCTHTHMHKLGIWLFAISNSKDGLSLMPFPLLGFGLHNQESSSGVSIQRGYEEILCETQRKGICCSKAFFSLVSLDHISHA